MKKPGKTKEPKKPGGSKGKKTKKPPKTLATVAPIGKPDPPRLTTKQQPKLPPPSKPRQPTPTKLFTALITNRTKFTRTKVIKTTASGLATLTPQQPKGEESSSVTLFGYDLTGIITWFNGIDNTIKYAAAAIFLLLLLLCFYRLCCIRPPEEPQTFVIVHDESRRKRRFRFSRSGTPRDLPRRSEKERDAPEKRRVHEHPSEAVERHRKSSDKRGATYEDRRTSDTRDSRGRTAPTMEGTMPTMTTDETMQSVDGPPVQAGYPPPPPPPPLPPAAPMKSVARVARNLKRLLRRSQEENRMPSRDTATNILDMMGNVPDNILGNPAMPATPMPYTPPPATAPTAPTAGSASAPGYEELGAFNNALFARPPAAQPPRRW